MPSYIPGGLEPSKKRGILDQRIVELRHAIRSGPSPDRISRAAEKVRAATLAVIKARRAILAEFRVARSGGFRSPGGDSIGRQEDNLGREFQEWSSLTVEEIVARHPLEVSPPHPANP